MKRGRKLWLAEELGRNRKGTEEALTPNLLSTECCSAPLSFLLVIEVMCLLGQPHREGARKSLGGDVVSLEARR